MSARISDATCVIVRAALCALLAIGAVTAEARERVLVAVATNFDAVLSHLVAEFESRLPAEVVTSSGSTGKLYAQIMAGAPYDVLLAADAERPRLLLEAGRAETGSGFTFALGRLTLWSRDADRIRGSGESVLARGDFRKLALANPALAPYGVAAREVLDGLGLWDALATRIAMGENVGQAYAHVATGNAELGFVARSSLDGPRAQASGSRWDVPASLHSPIRQDAVLLRHGADNAAARAFLDFLQTDAARATIQAFGYSVE